MLRTSASRALLALCAVLWSNNGSARAQATFAGLVFAQPADEVSPPPRPAPPPPYVLPPLADTILRDPPVDPLLDTGFPAPGFFGNVDFLFLRPHLNSELANLVQVSPSRADTVNVLTGGPMGTTFSPRVELGYRLGQQQGEFTLGYRFEDPEHTSVPADSSQGILQRDRLNMNLVDLTWGNRHFFALPPGWAARYNVGVRLATIYYDTLHEFRGPLINPVGLLEQRATSNFVGFGPQAGFEVSRELYFPGLAAVCRVQGSGLFGGIHQTFSETAVSGGAPLAGTSSARYQVDIPNLAIQAGLSYAPRGWNGSRFLCGYIWEEFWQIGRLNNNPVNSSNSGDLLNRGLFLRAEFKF
jgi:hypothetical protein